MMAKSAWRDFNEFLYGTGQGHGSKQCTMEESMQKEVEWKERRWNERTKRSHVCAATIG
jgi:hypothetical protein